MIKKINDPHAPFYELIINGVIMNETFMRTVDNVTFEDESELISSLSFTIRYSRMVKNGVSNDLLNMKLISPGNLVVLKGGYGVDLVEMGAGYVTNLEPDFREGQDPIIKVVCYSQLQKLSKNKSEKGETFGVPGDVLRDSQIASIIGERNGFIIRQSDTSSFRGIRKTPNRRIPRIQKRGSSDLSLLKEMAKHSNYEIFDKWDGKKKRFTMYFEPSRDLTGTEVMTFIYGDGSTPTNAANINGKILQTLKSFKPVFSISSQFTKYKVFSWDKKTAKKISFTLDMDAFMGGQEDLKLGGTKADKLLKKKAATSGAGVQQKSFGNVTEIISTRTFEDEASAKEYLINHMKKIAKDFITGSGTINGNQYLQSRQVHKFDGLGAFFNGNYFFKKVTHTFNSSGYNVGLDVRKVVKENA